MLVASRPVSLLLFDCEWTRRERPEYSDLLLLLLLGHPLPFRRRGRAGTLYDMEQMK